MLSLWARALPVLLALWGASLLSIIRFEPTHITRIQLEGRNVDYGNVLFSPDGRLLAYTQRQGSRGVVALWDIEASAAGPIFEMERLVRVHFSPDSAALLTVEASGQTRVWQTDGALKYTLPAQPAPVIDADFSPDGWLLATLAQDGAMRLWDAPGGTPRADLTGGDQNAHALMFSPDSRFVVALGMEHHVHVWSTETAQKTRLLRGDLVNELVLFTPQNSLLTYGASGRTRLWDTVTGEIIGRINYYGVYSAAVEANGTVLMAGKYGPNNQIHVFEMASGEELYAVGAGWAVFSPDARWLLTASGPDYRDGMFWGGGVYFPPTEVWLWDVRSRQRYVLYRGSRHIERLWFSPEGTRVGFLDIDGTIRILDLA